MLDTKILKDYGFKVEANCGIIRYRCGNYTIEVLDNDPSIPTKIEVCYGDLECELVDTLDDALEIIANWKGEYND